MICAGSAYTEAVHVDARPILRRLYRDLDGFDVEESAEAIVTSRGSSPIYGEIMPAATMRLLEHLALRPKDVLFDLGSGAGKLVLHAAVAHRLRRLVGVELVKERHRMAQVALERAKAQRVLRTKGVELLCRDFMRVDWSEASVVYTCSTAFPADLMRRLLRRASKMGPGTRFVTLQDFDDNPWFDLEEVLRLDMSWRRRGKVHIYRRR